MTFPRARALILACALLAVLVPSVAAIGVQAKTAASCQVPGAAAPAPSPPQDDALARTAASLGLLGVTQTRVVPIPRSWLFAGLAAFGLLLVAARRFQVMAPSKSVAYLFLASLLAVPVALRALADALGSGLSLPPAAWALPLAWSLVLGLATTSDDLSGRRLIQHLGDDLRALFGRPRRALLTAAVAGGVVLLGWWWISRQGARSIERFKQWYASQPRVSVPVPADGARVLLVKFNDYQCPPCRQTFREYEPVLRDYQARHPGALKVVTRDYPLEPECNPRAARALHPAACEAAAAVRVARRLGKAEAVERWLFDNQETLTAERVWDGAATITGVPGLKQEAMGAMEGVRADAALGASLGVSGTPTFFVNGVRLGPLPGELLVAALDYELGRP